MRKEFVAVALDRETAQASGLPVTRLDALLYVMITFAIVISLQAVGNILVLALLITPAATARLLTDKLATMMILSACIGGGASLVGLYVTYNFDLASGGLIVLILTGFFFLAWMFAPRHGMVLRTRRPSPQQKGHPRLRRADGRRLPFVDQQWALSSMQSSETRKTHKQR